MDSLPMLKLERFRKPITLHRGHTNPDPKAPKCNFGFSKNVKKIEVLTKLFGKVIHFVQHLEGGTEPSK